MTVIGVIVALIVAVAAAAAGYFIGYNNRKKTAEAQIGSAEAEATRLVNEAIKTADQKRKEAILEAKDEAFRLKAEVDAQKAEADKEIKQRRAEISRQENRIDQKETALDRKTEALEKREEELKKKHEEAEAHLAEVDALRAKEMERLETLAGLSQEDAREVLLHKVDEELTHEKAIRVAAYETDLKENCDGIARNLIGQAISRCAADHCSETTVSVVPLPSDEMKGRIIGREGRNIRALETATGVDLIIDDTPEAITLSSFDQTRREVARMTLERLIGDGRIHPARIEETVEKCRHDLELQMKREGERAVMELGIHGLHPDLIKLIGRLKYRTSFGQNALTHSMEVAWLAGLLAGEMGVNVTLARRAGLLHDIGKALDHEIEGSHVQIGVDICRKYKENTQVIHAIEAHHGDVEPKTPLAFIIQACDAISAARPGARRENVESYVKRLENLEEISSSFEGVEQAFAVQAGREVRIMVKPDVISDDQVILLARSIAKKIEDTLDYPGQIKVNVIRESRAVEYGLRSVSSSVQSLDFEDCCLQEIEWAPLLSNGAFPDPIHTLKDCSLKYNTFTEMNFNRFDFSNGNEIVGSMFAKCEMQLASFKGTELHETEFYQCDLRKADFRDATGYKVDILGSRMKDARFSLPEAVNLLADLKIKLS